MDALKRFSLAALAAILVAGAAPAFAQTRTDPEPDRPRVEDGDHGDSETARAQEGRLPKSTEGIRCLVKEGHGGLAVSVVNGTGKVIPAGTIVMFYMQPGNIQKLFKLEADWAPGKPIEVPLKGVQVSADSTCAVKVAPPTNEPTETPDDLPETPSNPLETPDDPPEPSQVGEVGCKVITGPPPFEATLDFKNIGQYNLPAGTKVMTVMPDGSIHEFVLYTDWLPGGNWGLEWPGGFPDDFQCEFTVIFPDSPPVWPENKYETGDTGPLPGFPEGVVMSASCEVVAHSQVSLVNSGNVPWPAGTYFEVTLPDGTVYTYTAPPVVPGGDMGIPDEVIYPNGMPEDGQFLPDDWTCQINMVLP